MEAKRPGILVVRFPCKVLYSDCLRRKSNFPALFGFNAPDHCLVRACLLHCMRVRFRNGYTQAFAHLMQYTHTHKAVTGRIEAKKLLSRRRQSNYSFCSCLSNLTSAVIYYHILSSTNNIVRGDFHRSSAPWMIFQGALTKLKLFSQFLPLQHI